MCVCVCVYPWRHDEVCVLCWGSAVTTPYIPNRGRQPIQMPPNEPPGKHRGSLPQPQPTYTRNCSIWVACTLWFECVCVCVFAWIHTNYTSITHQKVLYTLYRWVCLPTALLYVVLYRRCSAVQLRCNIEHTLHVHIHMCVCVCKCGVYSVYNFRYATWIHRTIYVPRVFALAQCRVITTRNYRLQSSCLLFFFVVLSVVQRLRFWAIFGGTEFLEG